MAEGRFLIEKLRIAGFKSIRGAAIELGPLNVVIGANGAGKSNLVAFFALLRDSLNGRLEAHVTKRGGPNAFLYLGSRTTTEIRCALTIVTEIGRGTLRQNLTFQAPDGIVSDLYLVPESDGIRAERWHESVWPVISENGPPAIVTSFSGRRGETIRTYHFNDTTLTAPIRSSGYVEDNRQLLANGGNLAAFLYRLKITSAAAYRRIVSTVRTFAPFLDDFSLLPRALDPTRILLNWRQKDSEYEFGPHQLSDGTLRAIALTALLLQPEDELPKLIVVDEPEIGLHPYAVSVIVSLFKKASHHTQIILATQSPQFLDECEAEDVICVERKGQESVFFRPDRANLAEWLADYSLGEIWQKNVIGGGPH